MNVSRTQPLGYISFQASGASKERAGNVSGTGSYVSIPLKKHF